MSMSPAHDAFTLNDKNFFTRTRRSPSPHLPSKSPPPPKLNRRNSNSQTTVPARRTHSSGNNALQNGPPQSPLRDIDEDDEKAKGTSAKAHPSTVDWEIPRKLLHASIGFVVAPLYVHGVRTSRVAAVLSAALVVVSGAEPLRFHVPSFERLYERVLGPFMREAEKSRVNGVVWYLVGVIITLVAFPTDLAVVSILILAWADTAASTFGRLWGRYTPPLPSHLLGLPIAKRKSLAGFMAASLTGALIAVGFWGWFAPLRAGGVAPDAVWTFEDPIVGGWLGLGIVGLVAGAVTGVVESLDLGSLDDNLTLPVLSGASLRIFLQAWHWLFS